MDKKDRYSLPGCIVIVLLVGAFNVLAGAFTVQYVIDFWGPYIAHRPVHAPLLPCAVVGLFVAEISIPAALITWVISLVI